MTVERGDTLYPASCHSLALAILRRGADPFSGADRLERIPCTRIGCELLHARCRMLDLSLCPSTLGLADNPTRQL